MQGGPSLLLALNHRLPLLRNHLRNPPDTTSIKIKQRLEFNNNRSMEIVALLYSLSSMNRSFGPLLVISKNQNRQHAHGFVSMRHQCSHHCWQSMPVHYYQ